MNTVSLKIPIPIFSVGSAHIKYKMLDYTKRAKNYDKRWKHYCLPSFSKSIQIIDLYQDSRLLDVGCGTGIFLKILEKKYPSAQLNGIDSNQAMLAKASEKLSSKVDLELGSAESLPYDSQSFDWLVLSNCLGHIKNQEVALSEAHRVLKNDGKVIITDWTKDFLAMQFVNRYTQLFDYAEYNSLKSSEAIMMMEKLHFECLSAENYKINWFWGLYTILGIKR